MLSTVMRQVALRYRLSIFVLPCQDYAIREKRRGWAAQRGYMYGRKGCGGSKCRGRLGGGGRDISRARHQVSGGPSQISKRAAAAEQELKRRTSAVRIVVVVVAVGCRCRCQ
jgi:hypothetical protein